ncbi:MAG: peptide chain release factor 1 [candidate division WOR-3 bacterium]|nr:peptide chain release factor 1 [candidate division WOR-3 bacterium]
MESIINFSFKELENRLRPFVSRKQQIEQLLADPKVLADGDKASALSKEYKDIATVLQMLDEYKQVEKELQDIEELKSASEDEIREMAARELLRLQHRQQQLLNSILYFLLPKDPLWQGDCIVEIRAAAGGEESAIFAADLFRMYTKYIEKRKLSLEVLSSRFSDLNGIKEIIFSVEGPEAYRYFRFESGVHRVQRIPITEASGRIHTSTVTVAVLPEPKEIEFKIDPKDLKIDVFRAGGHGGQHVNVTDSAVRITHIPTGIVVSCQDERSQLQNKQRAMKILRARLLEAKRAEEEKKLGEKRRSQIGTGDRAEKIRTYNFPQNRVTDHRIGLSLYNLNDILDGNLDVVFEALETAEIAKAISELANNN